VKKKIKKVKTTKAVRQSPEVGQSRVKLPDFRARVRRIYGDRVFQVSGAELIRQIGIATEVSRDDSTVG
jgi:hypothetical protein